MRQSVVNIPISPIAVKTEGSITPGGGITNEAINNDIETTNATAVIITPK